MALRSPAGGCERVAEVVDQISQEGDRVREREDDDLDPSRHAEDQQAERDRLDPCPGAQDRAIDETVRMVMAFLVVVQMLVVVIGVVGRSLHLTRKR